MKATLNGNRLTLEIELDAGRPSKTGKSLIVYTTGGFVPVAGNELKLNLNIIKPR